ncbi:metalloregulator ArsR/SmtB family transcription factor [Streptosporangiaceae bacterium NEAU-GS5]|nr:metalloregulator ArsR/SmtB family transcription factor [Streptosporangiaceae bacterium NEAU-GS5]
MTAGLETVMSAVADGSRRVILQRLAHGPATTGQLADLLPMSRPAASQHIKVLQEAGLVRTTLAGRHRWHHLNTEALGVISDWARRTAAIGRAAPRLRPDGRPEPPIPEGETMIQPVSYVELNSPDLEATTAFLSAAFGWRPQPFAAPDYLVAAHGDVAGVDTGIMPSRDGRPRAIPVIRVEEMDASLDRVRANGGTVVVEPFTIPGVGHGCYVTDPAGLLIGLHAYDADA